MGGFDNYDQWKTASPYDDDPGYDHADLEKALEAIDYGRNKPCFPILSFGGKDADLEPCGCTGIKEFGGDLSGTHPKLTVEVGGHKTVVPPDDWGLEIPESRMVYYMEIATEIVCGAFPVQGEWTGDDWVLYFSDRILVDPVWDEEAMELDYPATAQAIKDAAEKRCEEFSRETRLVDEAMNELYKEAEHEIARINEEGAGAEAD